MPESNNYRLNLNAITGEEGVGSENGEPVLSLEKDFRHEVKLTDLLGQLPPLPESWLRLTHFTNERSAKELNNGSDFDYSRQGFISSTTDPYSNETLHELPIVLETGKAGVFQRRQFGNCMMLIDMDGHEFKQRESPSFRYADIPNKNIIGYVKIDKSVSGGSRYLLYKNPYYKPTVNSLEPLRNRLLMHSEQSTTPTNSTPTLKGSTESGEIDIW